MSLSQEISAMSLCEVADCIRAGDITAVETLEATFDVIDVLEPVYRAFVWQDREVALARAKVLDAARQAGATLGALHGVPMAHKDMYYREGVVSGCGSRIRAQTVARETSVALAMLDAAGAIDVGGLAMVEFAMGPHGYNEHLPRSLNPWNQDRIPCGSSSGSGVAVASRMVFGSLGSDTGGSIRCPAAANGIVGCLPTHELVSRRGSMAMSWSLDCVGPLTRTVRDAARILSQIAGTTASDYEADIEEPIRGLRIGVPSGYFDEDLDPIVAKCVASSLDVFRAAGAHIVPVSIPDCVAMASELHPLIMKAEAAANHKSWKRNFGKLYSAEVGRRLEAGFFILATDYLNALQYRAFALQTMLSDVFGKVDVLHTPVLPIPTPMLAQTAYRSGQDYIRMVVSLTRNTRPINFLGLPALSVTCGFTPDGMPTSFQLVGKPYDEAALFRLGHRFQEETNLHRIIPPSLCAVP